MRIDIDTIGFDKIERELVVAGADVVPKARQIVRRTAFGIQRDAAIIAPVDTGALSNSISTDFRDTSGGIEAEVGPTVDYAHYVEDGTSRMNGQPYMRPATDRNLPSMNEAFDRLAGL